MSKSLVVMLAVVGLVSSLAFAAPKVMSDASLDKVAAGTSVFDFVFGDGAAPVTTAQLPADAAAAETGGIALNGTGDAAAIAENLAVAGIGDTAVNGTRSIAIRDDNDDNTFSTGDYSVTFGYDANENAAALGDYSVALGYDNEDNGIAIGDRSVAMGDDNYYNNTVTGDNSNGLYIDSSADDSTIVAGNNNIAANFYDVYDGSAVAVGTNNVVSGAYDNDVSDESVGVYGNYNETVGIIDNDGSQVIVGDNNTAHFTYVDISITDSFNVTTNTVDISGQDNLTAIVNANSLAFQGIGVNMTITNATASVPTMQGDVAFSIPVIAGNALAVSVLEQANINNSIIVTLGNGNIDIN